MGDSFIIRYTGNGTAEARGVSYTAKGGKHDPVHPLVRRLIAEAIIGRDDMVEVHNEDGPSLKPRAAHLIADVDIYDDPVRGFRTFPAFIGPHATGSVAEGIRARFDSSETEGYTEEP